MIRNFIMDKAKSKKRSLVDIVYIAVHRILLRDIPPEEQSGLDVSKFFTDGKGAPYTGGMDAYTLLLPMSGGVDQVAPLTDVTMHARKWNVPAIGLGVIGDFRKASPTRHQWNTLVDLSVELVPWVLGNRDPEKKYSHVLQGHMELPGGSSDPKKQCPGDRLDMHTLRASVDRILADKGASALEGMTW